MNTVVVQVVAVHLRCDRCGDRQRIRHDHDDAFTTRVLQPLASWWVAHRGPHLDGLELLANGKSRPWRPTEPGSTP